MTKYKTSDFRLEVLPSEYDHVKKYKITCGDKVWRVIYSANVYSAHHATGVRTLTNFPIGKQLIEFVKNHA